jgi:rubrerythrin
MDVGTTLKLAQAVEDMAGDLYRLLALRSAGDPALAAVFRRLEGEEREHARRLQMLGSLYLKDAKAFRGTQLEIPGLEAIVAETRAFLMQVEKGAFDVPGATARLVELEDRFAVTHAEVVARNADPGVRTLFQMLASQDREHAALLRNRGVKAG